MGGRPSARRRNVVIKINATSSTVLALSWAIVCIAMPTAVLTVLVFLERAQVRSSAPPLPPPAAPVAKPPDRPSDEKEHFVDIREAIDSFAAVASLGVVPVLEPVALPPVVV